MKSKLTLFLLIGTLLSCAKSTSSTSNSDTNSATASIASNQTLSSFPHKYDIYKSSDATSAIVFLHGGGGKKEGVASSLGIKSSSSTSDFSFASDAETWLIQNKLMLVFPQGQALSSAPLATTWTNYVMNSGQDDIAFLQALVAELRSNYPGLTKFYLAGHSNGGMMTNRMWCESPQTFDAYATLAGPPSSQLAVAGAHPCNPSTVKPFLAIVGDSDNSIQTTGNLSSVTWTLSSYNSSSAAWVSATVLNDKIYHTRRSILKCSESSSNSSTSGNITTLSNCSGTIKHKLIMQSAGSGGDHCLDDLVSSCTTTLKGNNDFDYKSEIWSFFSGI